jgi:hypothetical protein
MIYKNSYYEIDDLLSQIRSGTMTEKVRAETEGLVARPNKSQKPKARDPLAGLVDYSAAMRKDAEEFSTTTARQERNEPTEAGGDLNYLSSRVTSGVSLSSSDVNLGEIAVGIRQTAESLGIDPTDLATAISYETAGTFDPTKKGPTTKWGTHKGLIQFGEPQAKEYGVDWNNPVSSQLGPDGAVAKYLRKAGVKPGMGLLDVYSAINAGRVGRYNASDEAVGGAKGNVREKVAGMQDHRKKAILLIDGAKPRSRPSVEDKG